MKLSDDSGYYEIEVTVFDVKRSDFGKVELSVKNIWPFGQWHCGEGRLFSTGIGHLDTHQIAKQEFADALASAIWNKTNRFYRIEVNFTRLMRTKSKSVSFDESSFMKLCLKLSRKSD